MLNSTKDFVDSLTKFYGDSSKSMLTPEPYPRWKPPKTLVDGTFENEASNLYRKEISKSKMDQDAEDLINKGNDFYFAMMVKKAYNLFSRSRIATVAIDKSLEKGLSDTKHGFLEKKYKLLGDKIDPNDAKELKS